jgi:hypothetical protein
MICRCGAIRSQKQLEGGIEALTQDEGRREQGRNES